MMKQIEMQMKMRAQKSPDRQSIVLLSWSCVPCLARSSVGGDFRFAPQLARQQYSFAPVSQ
jgi:hypothetical protein